jgi:hypothetical protein
MAEECAQCGAYFGSPGDLMVHVRTAHKRPDPQASLNTNPESHIPGLVCALCGQRFPTPEALSHHGLRPHYRSNRPIQGVPTWV